MKLRLLKDFKITKKAKKRIDELKSENDEIFIRVMIASGGCGGHQYYILMDDYIGEKDYVLRKKFNNKIKIYVVIDEQSLELLHGATMDFKYELEFSGFQIKNPNALSTCSCGNSFSCSGGFIAKKQDCKN